MRTRKVKELIPEWAEKNNMPQDHVWWIISSYFRHVAAATELLIHPRVDVKGLGVLRIKGLTALVDSVPSAEHSTSMFKHIIKQHKLDTKKKDIVWGREAPKKKVARKKVTKKKKKAPKKVPNITWRKISDIPDDEE